MRTICCFMEQTSDKFNEFIEKHDNDSYIHLYTDIINSCEDNMFYCLGELYNIILQADDELWFVTDVPNLYNIVMKLYDTVFEDIIVMESENDKNFASDFDLKELIEFEINVQSDTLYKKYMSKLFELSDLQNKQDIMIFSCELIDLPIENDYKKKMLFYHFTKLLFEYTKETAGTYYKLCLLSILMKLGKKAEYTNNYFELVRTAEDITEDNKYFAWNQFKAISLRNFAVYDKTTNCIVDDIYTQAYNTYMKKCKEMLSYIPFNERNKDVVIVMTTQYLNNTHAPTRTVMERCKALRELGKVVIIINTTEQYIMQGVIPMYRAFFGTTIEEYDDMQSISIDGEEFPFMQLSEDYPIYMKLQILSHLIKKIKPYYILSIGTGSMLADLCGHMVPVACMALAFSTLPHTKNKMKILGRKLSEEEKENYKDKDEDIIESRFTFELKPQKEHYPRETYNLPKDRFILVVVGIRLQSEIDDEFMKLLSRVCEAGCYVVFAGIMDNYDDMMKKYQTVKENSSFIGFCDDVSALMEICDLYVNPPRLGGGFSVIEAFDKGKPGVYMKVGDVYTSGGEEFAVDTYDDMYTEIIRYKEDKAYYDEMAQKGRERARLMTSSVEAIRDIDEQICKRITEG